MADLRQKVKLSLDEARLLVLGSQILLGFQYRSVLQSGFDALPMAYQHLKVASLIALLLTILLLMWPASYQQIAEDGEVTADLHRFATRAMCWALAPFALALGEEFAAVTHLMMGAIWGIVIGGCTALVAFWFWYGLEFYCRRNKSAEQEAAVKQKDREQQKKTPLHDKIDDALTECRVVIPGAQALLGFQMIAMLTEGFVKLPRASQYVHLAALLLIALSTILIMTPAAFHRIVEQGEDSERFWRHTRRMLMWGMAALAAGIAAEFYVVVRKCMNSNPLAVGLALLVLIGFYGAWFGYTTYRRHLKAAVEQLEESARSAVLHR